MSIEAGQVLIGTSDTLYNDMERRKIIVSSDLFVHAASIKVAE